MEANKLDLLNPSDSIISLALRDPEFKKRLLANPKLAIEGTFGVQIPKDIEIKVLEDSNNQLHMEILNAKSGHKELSDAELSAISGGCKKEEDTREYDPVMRDEYNNPIID